MFSTSSAKNIGWLDQMSSVSSVYLATFLTKVSAIFAHITATDAQSLVAPNADLDLTSSNGNATPAPKIAKTVPPDVPV